MKKLEHYIQVGQQKLRCGYTTGTCAAAAARAAAELLYTGFSPTSVLVDTPAGLTVEIEVEESVCTAEAASCSVRKDGGDDPDITNGLLITATVCPSDADTDVIDGGEGVGRVTRPGLDQPVGNAAINSTPRAMIARELEEARRQSGKSTRLRCVISIPEGCAIAQRTFNPKLGIVGGLSVLGTSGIVRPMSEAALISSIQRELEMLRAEGVTELLISPGNYGADYCRDVLGLELKQAVQCSNYLGETIDRAVFLGFRSILLVGHIGKLIKVAAGVMNTHSRVADCRMEILAAHAALHGGDRQLVEELFSAVSTDAGVELLKNAGLLEVVMDSICQKVQQHLESRTGSAVKIGAVLFSNRFGLLGQTHTAQELLNIHQQKGAE